MRGQPRIVKRRDKPYTAIGIKRVLCARCGVRRAQQQWQICSDGNTWRGLCNVCDIELNQLVLDFMGFPDREVKIAVYREKLKLREA